MSFDRKRALALGAVCAAIAGCAAHLSDPERFEALLDGDSGSSSSSSSSPCGDVPTLLSMRCATSGCHTATDKTAGLDLQSPGVFARLVGQKASGGTGVLIDPQGDPNSSILYLKLLSPAPYGSQMPLLGTKLDPTTVACVASWIMSGAGVSPTDATTSPSDTGAAPADSGTGASDSGTAPTDATTTTKSDAAADAAADAGVRHRDAAAAPDAAADAGITMAADSGPGDAASADDAAQE
jgi:hypothetical protein